MVTTTDSDCAVASTTEFQPGQSGTLQLPQKPLFLAYEDPEWLCMSFKSLGPDLTAAVCLGTDPTPAQV